MDRSANWITLGYPILGLSGGSTAAQLLTELESAPFVAAGPSVHSRVIIDDGKTCAVKDCHACFRTASELEQHASDIGHKAFLCICGKSYARLFTLTRHINEAVEPQQHNYPCCDCPAFSRLDHVTNHLLSHHRMSKKTASNAPLGPQQVASRRSAGRRKAAGVVAAVSTTTTAATVPTSSSVSLSLPMQPSVGPSLLPSDHAYSANAIGPAAVSAADYSATFDVPLPAPAGMLNAGMDGPIAMPAAEAASTCASNEVDWTAVMAEVDFTNLGF